MTCQTLKGQTGPALGPAYNLFRRKLAPDLCCAASEDRPVPAFLDGDGWEYAGTLHRTDVPPPGFDPAAAELGIRLNGFHLFQMVGRIVARTASSLSPDRMDRGDFYSGSATVDSVRSRPPGDRRAHRIPEGEPRATSAH